MHLENAAHLTPHAAIPIVFGQNKLLTAFFNLLIVAILLANTRKSLKFYRFESAQDLVSFINLDFFSLTFVLNLFLCVFDFFFFKICYPVVKYLYKKD